MKTTLYRWNISKNSFKVIIFGKKKYFILFNFKQKNFFIRDKSSYFTLISVK